MIKNEAKITNDVEVNINRAAIEHRATWMGLIFDELRKDGIDPEPAFRRAIRRCGNFHGKGFNSRKHAVAPMMVKNSQAYSSESLVRRPSRWTYTK